MKVIVKDYLNVRVGKPSVNAPTYQYLAPGSEIEVEDTLYEGDKFDGTTKWLKDKAGNYYWAGGTTSLIGSLSIVKNNNPSEYNYNQLINLPKEIRETKGEGVTVALLDTGCFMHKALEGAIHEGYDVLVNSKVNYNDSSTNGHGTGLAGIIGARENTPNKVIGVAPMVKLIIVKAIKDESVLSENILTGLKWIRDNVQVDMINMSFSLYPGNLTDKINEVLSELSNKGVLLFGAGEDDNNIFANDILYPANQPNVIGIGALNTLKIVPTQRINSQIAYIIPQTNYRSTSNFISDYNDDFIGCSFASALFTGAAALTLSYKRKNGDSRSVIDLLNSNLPQFNATQYSSSRPFNIFKI